MRISLLSFILLFLGVSLSLTSQEDDFFLQGEDKDAGLTEFDEYMCKEVMKDCIDLDWTKDIDPKYYWDKHHFNEPVHRVFNEELLDRMGKLPKDYVKYDKSLLLMEDN